MIHSLLQSLSSSIKAAGNTNRIKFPLMGGGIPCKWNDLPSNLWARPDALLPQIKLGKNFCIPEIFSSLTYKKEFSEISRYTIFL